MKKIVNSRMRLVITKINLLSDNPIKIIQRMYLSEYFSIIQLDIKLITVEPRFCDTIFRIYIRSSVAQFTRFEIIMFSRKCDSSRLIEHAYDFETSWNDWRVSK